MHGRHDSYTENPKFKIQEIPDKATEIGFSTPTCPSVTKGYKSGLAPQPVQVGKNMKE